MNTPLLPAYTYANHLPLLSDITSPLSEIGDEDVVTNTKHPTFRLCKAIFLMHLTVPTILWIFLLSSAMKEPTPSDYRLELGMFGLGFFVIYMHIEALLYSFNPTKWRDEDWLIYVWGFVMASEASRALHDLRK